MKESKLSELVQQVQNGDNDALRQLVQRFMPLIKKYGHHNPDDEAALILWIADAIQRYKPNTSWGKDELEQFKSKK
ncbi:helix-turn-helix domain-containing protein [Alicyclobacillus suci]|uniref:helix-turn-helix domain-containing protein n=1 Tax=Alicyclobacillus suci TaxID=2816080 RepID=UPI001A8DD488|nr:helix-turn-helix domain-containing protein [Alicyclobacillus suci]